MEPQFIPCALHNFSIIINIHFPRQKNSTLSLNITHIFLTSYLDFNSSLETQPLARDLLACTRMRKRVLYEKWAFIVTILHDCDYMYV